MATHPTTRCRVRCEDCGDVRVDVDDLVLRVCDDDHLAAFRFRCPECALVHVVPAMPAASSALVDAGVVTERWSLPAELHERPTSGRPITITDVDTFRELIEDEAAVATALHALA